MAKQKKPIIKDQEKYHIRLIICRNKKQRAIELIMLNGYAGNLVAAEKIWMVENGLIKGLNVK